MIPNQRGFTLIEIMVALAIFGMLSIGAYSVLDAGMRSKQQTELRLDQLSTLQRTIQSIERDLRLLSQRQVRDELGDRLPLFRGQSESSGQASYIEFTRSGWRNPAGLPRSNLQHLIYNFEQGQLKRLHSIFLDQTNDSPKVSRELLDDIQKLSFTFLDHKDQWVNTWGAFGFENSGPALPRAVKLSMTLEPFGLIERLIILDVQAKSKTERETNGDQQ